MFKLLITNIIRGTLFGIFVAFILSILALGLGDFFPYRDFLILQSIIGFLLSIPIINTMWKQTKEINNKSILLLGGPTISISDSLVFLIASTFIGKYDGMGMD